jgi:hypothetical protein
VIRSPLKAIRAYCLDCGNGQYSEVRECPSCHCSLYNFRFGKNPYTSRKPLTEEQKVKRVHQLQSCKKLSTRTGAKIP